MRRVIAAALVALLLIPSAIAAPPAFDLKPQFRQPEPSTTEEAFTIRLQRSIEGPCVEVDRGGASIIMRREPLEALARYNPLSKSEVDRIASIRAERARALLRAAGVKEDSDCVVVRAGRDLAVGGLQYLLREILESGNAVVRDNTTGRNLETITARYFGNAAGGFISFDIAPDWPILVIDWYVS